MRIFITLLFIFCLLSTASSEIQFEDVSHQVGITRIGESWGNAWGDFDGDGFLDLWATNHRHKPSLYRNNGDGTFTDIIDVVWDANPHADTHGVAWADYDNDGDQDLIILSGSGGGLSSGAHNNHANHFYVNENGILIERAAELGIDYPLLRGRTPLWFDWNSDGKLDVLLTGITRTDSNGNLVTSALFGQTVSGFENESDQAGFSLEDNAALAQLASITPAGTMHLVVSYHRYPLVVFDTSIVPFINTTESLTIPNGYSVQDAVIADFNGDLLSDIFFVRGLYQSFVGQVDANTLELNLRSIETEKGLSFKTTGNVSYEIYSEWGPRVNLVKIGVDGHQVIEFQDGEFVGVMPTLRAATYKVTLSPNDPKVVGLKARPQNENFGIYVGYEPETQKWTFLSHKRPVSAIIKSSKPITEIETINFSTTDLKEQPPSRLLINNGGNVFHVSSALGGPGTFSDGRCVAAGDFDNDMDLDIYVVRSRTSENPPNHLYENLGNGSFIERASSSGIVGSKQGRGQSATVADYDKDGYLDIFVTNGRGEYPFSEGPDQLFRNISSGNNWLQIDLEGTVSNRDGIGARLFATTPDGKTQLRENGGGIHWSQQDQKRIHFGLGQNDTVSELAIYWPSGILQKLTDIKVNQVLHVIEKGIQTQLPGDVNQDGQVDILDLLVVISHFGESPPANERIDANKDGEVNLDDVVWIIQIIEGNQNNTAAPSQKDQSVVISSTMLNRFPSLTENDIELLYAFYLKIEEIQDDSTPIELVKQFLKRLLMPGNSPMKTQLHANYPNPFNPETWIPYQLAEDAEITIRIYDTSGKIVRTIFSGHQASGYYISRSKAAYWDGQNEFGEAVASGVYIYELVTPKSKLTKRLVVLK
ncbi:hypothetical protein C6501_18410 [Candidatus Poribacteria bacterium]|nr:MAG: hypothetical protein C6501_18410 [Candidatus Poribacteria bacterium]